MSRADSTCRLAFTDERFVFAGRSYPDVPVLVDARHRFVEPVCDYLRWRVVYGRLKPTSARTYAEALLHFWNFMVLRRRDVEDVDDELLLEWLNSQALAEVSTQAARLDAVFELYVWLESEGYVRQVVRIPGFNDHEPFRPRLSSRPVRGGPYRRAASRFGIVSALRPRPSSTGPLPTPGTDDIGRLHAAVDAAGNPDVADRNHLLLDWYVQTGVRRKEWRSLTVGQIPGWGAIDAAREALHVSEVLLTETKGDRPRHVGVLPELLERTREYIEGPRAELVRRFRRKYGTAYREPEEVFLSNKTGGPMDPKAISNLLASLFEKSGVEGHGHRLRATYLTRLFEAELMLEQTRIAAHPGYKLRVDFELVLRRVAERAGQRNVDSLRPYLTLARKFVARQPGRGELLTVQQLLDAKRDELARLETQIERIRTEPGLKSSPLRTPRSEE
jgi:integrase